MVRAEPLTPLPEHRHLISLPITQHTLNHHKNITSPNPLLMG